MKVSYLGNFGPTYSTESHVALSLESLGHEVNRIQEGETPAADVPVYVERFESDLFLHTQTYGLALSSGTKEEREIMVDTLNSICPTAFFHLDLWWGLARQDQLLDESTREPWTRYHHVFTADGGHPDQWRSIGVNHHWLPPGVVHTEAYDGTPRREFMCDIAFVGSWRGYGHEEHWPTRQAMLRQLERRYSRRFAKFPIRQAIRGTDLTDLYASCKIVVGDSCMAGQIPNYWSDRVPETIGRGGFLVHPYVHGIETIHPYSIYYEAGNWDEMFKVIDIYLEDERTREYARDIAAKDCRENHTYRSRMQELLSVVFDD